MYKSTKQTGPEQSRDFADSILTTGRQTEAYFRLEQIMSLSSYKFQIKAIHESIIIM